MNYSYKIGDTIGYVGKTNCHIYKGFIVSQEGLAQFCCMIKKNKFLYLYVHKECKIHRLVLKEKKNKCFYNNKI